MPFDEKSADRLRAALRSHDSVEERKMMGGLIFMVNGHMCCGIHQDSLMVRVGAEAAAKLLKRKHVVPLDIGAGRHPKAFICVQPAGFATRRELLKWVQAGLDFVNSLPSR